MDELADLVHDLRLAALEVADEVPAERVAVALVLGHEVLRAVLADDLDARLGERGHVRRARRTSSPRRRSRRGRPRPGCARSARGRRQRDKAEHALASARAPASRRCEKKRSGLQRGARVEAVDVGDARGAQGPLGRRPEVELPARCMTSPPKRRRERARPPPRRPRSSTARSPARPPLRASRRRARRHRPRRSLRAGRASPAWSDARPPARRRSPARPRSGRQSAVSASIGSPGWSSRARRRDAAASGPPGARSPVALRG